MKTFRSLLWPVLLLLVCVGAAAQAPLKRPQDVGLSAARLQRVDAFIARMQAAGKLAGAVTVVARRGQVATRAHGLADLDSKRAMRVDDIFQIQSMTQPITVVAVLMLLEEGRFLLSDPVARFLPEFADMKVALPQADAPEGHVLAPLRRAITIHDLLTHRAGFVGVPPSINPPAEALRRKALQSLPANHDYTLEQYVAVLAASPLGSQPGTTLRYGPATEVLGRLVEVVSGRSLPEFFAERIFQPLGMVDTAFTVPVEKQGRVVTAYSRAADGALVAVPPYTMAPKFFSAAGNVFSTPADYLRFCQMLLAGGQGPRGADGKSPGVRLLGRKSVELMTARHVESYPMPWLAGQHVGLGVSVRTAGGESGLIGSAGAYGWAGGYSTYFRIDPQEELILMLFVQQAYVAGNQELQFGFHNTVMQAIVD